MARNPRKEIPFTSSQPSKRNLLRTLSGPAWRTRSHHTFRTVCRRARPPPTGDTAESSAEKGEVEAMVPVITPITGTRAATEGRSDAINITGGDVRTTGGDDTFDDTFDET